MVATPAGHGSRVRVGQQMQYAVGFRVVEGMHRANDRLCIVTGCKAAKTRGRRGALPFGVAWTVCGCARAGPRSRRQVTADAHGHSCRVQARFNQSAHLGAPGAGLAFAPFRCRVSDLLLSTVALFRTNAVLTIQKRQQHGTVGNCIALMPPSSHLHQHAVDPAPR